MDETENLTINTEKFLITVKAFLFTHQGIQ